MRALAKKLYPDVDELAVFAMSVSIVLLSVIHEEFRILFFGILAALVFTIVENVSQATWEATKIALGAGLMLLLIISNLAAGSYLPFTKRKLDGLLMLVLFFNAGAICVGNFIASQTDPSPLNHWIFVLSTLWALGLLICVRFDERFIATTDRQATPGEAGVVALGLIGAGLVMVFFLEMHWAHCYTFCVCFAAAISRIFVTTPES